MRLKLSLGLALLGLALAAPRAGAVTLPPDGSSVTINAGSDPFADADLVTVGTLVSNETATNGVRSLDVTLTSWVLRSQTTGFLTFVFQVANASTPASNTALHLLNVADWFPAYGPYDATYYQQSAGQRTPDEGYGPVQFSEQLGFTFPGSAHQINPGQTSALIVVTTTATAFASTKASVHDTNIGVQNLDSFRPVPEPGTLALAFAALPLLGLYRLRRREG